MNAEAGAGASRARKRTWVLLGLGGVILCAVVWSALGGPGVDTSPLPQPPPIPDPNGYDDVLEAGRTIEQAKNMAPRLDLAKADETVLGPIVAANREAIARARKGLDKPFQVPVVYHVDYIIGVLMRDAGSIRGGLVRGLTAEGRLAVIQGRTDDATTSYSDQIRLGEAMSHHVPMMGYLMSIAVESTGLHNLRDLRDKLSPDQCRPVIHLLQEIDGKRERASDIAKSETQFGNANVRRMGILPRILLKVSGVQAKEIAQAVSTLDSSERRQNTARRLLLTDLALRVYRLEHGEDPPDLGALVPSILKSVPIDPYSDRPLLYLKRGKDGEVYSVGPDRDDDKLAKPLPVKHVDTADGDYTIDSF
jgi:hypothetical protein